jgi:hypothetical protein
VASALELNKIAWWSTWMIKKGYYMAVHLQNRTGKTFLREKRKGISMIYKK